MSPPVRLYIESADPREIQAYLTARGGLDGVALPSAAFGPSARPTCELVQAICRLVPGPVSVPAVATGVDEILAQARAYAAVAPNVVVDVATGQDGVEAIRRCTAERIATSNTGCRTPEQALAAASAGARWVAPWPERDVRGENVVLDLARRVRGLLRTYGLKTEVVVPARTPAEVLEAALVGAHAVSAIYAVLSRLPPLDGHAGPPGSSSLP